MVDQAGGAANLTNAQRATIVGASALLGGLAASLAGQNAQGGVVAAANEALNNGTADHTLPAKPFGNALNIACAGGTKTCDTTLMQTIVQADGANAQQALGGMQAAAPYVIVGGALVVGGALFGPAIVTGCAANPVLCANEFSILAGDTYAGLNGMPAGTGASVVAGASGAPNTAAGTANSVSGARLGMQLSAEESAGALAPTSISTYSDHALEQIAGRDGGIGVSQAALDDAFANPTAIQYVPSKYGPTFKYVGQNATVVVNSQGNVVTAWGTSASGVPR